MAVNRVRGSGAVLGDMITKFPIPTLPEIEPRHPDHNTAHRTVRCN
jgi:hypothetical protein